jgi:hypothetical protein
LLPNVDIRMRPDKTKEDAEVNCEIDYLSYGETVLVVPDVKRSTVGIGDMHTGRETNVVWLESAGVGG